MISLIFDASIALFAGYVALAHLRVYWSYIIAGELVGVFGLSIVFNLFYPSVQLLNASSWDYLYSATQLLTLMALVFAVAPGSAKVIYAIAAILAFFMGAYGHAGIDLLYQLSCGLFDIAKVFVIAWGWHCAHHYGRGNRFNRLHVWQN